MTYDHDGKLIRFDLNGKRVSGTVVKTHDRRHVTVRGRSGKTVKVDMLDQHGVVALPSGLEVTTIWNEDHPPNGVPADRAEFHRAVDDPPAPAVAPAPTLKPARPAQAPTTTTEQMIFL